MCVCVCVRPGQEKETNFVFEFYRMCGWLTGAYSTVPHEPAGGYSAAQQGDHIHLLFPGLSQG